MAIKSFAGPKLPSDQPYNLPKNSLVEFEVKFKDPQKLVTHVSTDWAFRSQKLDVLDYTVTEWPNGTMYNTFPEKGLYVVEVTVRATLKGNQKWSFLFVKTLFVKGWQFSFLLWLFFFFLINYNVPIVLESLVMIADIWLMLMYKQ